MRQNQKVTPQMYVNEKRLQINLPYVSNGGGNNFDRRRSNPLDVEFKMFPSILNPSPSQIQVKPVDFATLDRARREVDYNPL